MEPRTAVIRCEYKPSHEWMTFCCWYSLGRTLPDTRTVVWCGRRCVSYDIFRWPRRLGVPLKFEHDASELEGPVLWLEPWHVALRDFPGVEDSVELRGSGFCCGASEGGLLPFASYEEGCGKFVTSEWIDSVECPFSSAESFMTHDAGVNEVRILKLWRHLDGLFTSVSRG